MALTNGIWSTFIHRSRGTLDVGLELIDTLGDTERVQDHLGGGGAAGDLIGLPDPDDGHLQAVGRLL